MASYVMAKPTLNHELGVGQRHAFAAAAETSKISTESSALRRETLREAGGRVRLDALELAEAGPGEAHCLIVGWWPRHCVGAGRQKWPLRAATVVAGIFYAPMLRQVTECARRGLSLLMSSLAVPRTRQPQPRSFFGPHA